MESIHVLHIIDGLKVGGAETLLYNLAQGLPHDQFRLSIAYSTPGPYVEQIRELGIPLTRLPRLARIDPLLFWNMYSLIRRTRPDIVHTHLFKSDFHGRPAARLAGVPIVVSALQNCDNWAKNPIYGAVFGQTVRFADMLIAASEEVQEFAIRYIGARPDQVITIPNAVPIERFRNIQEAGVRLRQEFNIAPQAPVVGIVARLMPQKDHATFLAAAARVHQQIPAVRFLIVGEGPLLPRLIAQTQELGLQNAVIFAGLRRDVPAVMAAIDILAFSSKWEGLPVAMLEGMAASKPVVATAINGIPGVLADGKMGILAPPSNPEALAKGIVALLANPVMAHSMGAAGYEHVAAHYSISASIQRTAELYQRLIRQHRDKGAFSGAMS